MLRWIRDRLFRRPGEAGARACRQGEERVEAWMRQGRASHEAGDFATAEGFYQRVLDEQPDQADALYRLGEIEALRQNNEHAAGLIRRAISIDAEKAQFHFALGCVQQA